mmetsp:Transcript_31724/g.91107  ORF Transcript_31724/g.91107 Transcript_31724/m.91107 type:complete len:294 (-) Transcript_31724:343-1224(-)
MASGSSGKQVVLVTGCSSGLGRALCFELSKRPDIAVVATARKLAAVAELKEKGVAALALEVDVGSEASLKDAMEQASALGGGAIDAVICNAGMSAFGPLALQPMSEVQAMLDTNTLGVLRTVQAAVPFMAKPRGHGGRILIVGSVSATLTTPFAGAYCASKAAAHALGEALRMELKPLGISVTNVHAGSIKTSFSANAESGSSLDRYADGWYASVLDAIKMRIWASQTAPSVQSAEQVAEDIVRKGFGTGPSPAAICVAGGARKLLLYGFIQKWLPASLMDAAQAKMFGLARL